MPDVRCRYLWTGEGCCTENAIIKTSDTGTITSIENLPHEQSLNCDCFFAMPSFTDAHCHVSWMAVKAASVDFSGAGSAEEFLSMVESAVSSREQTIVRGESFDQNEWAVPEIPSLARLDDVSGDVPVFLRRVCGHSAIVNSAMLRLITAESKDINRATGVLQEWASLNFDSMFPHPPEALSRAFSSVASMVFSKGVTGVCSMENCRDAAALLQSELPFDVSIALTDCRMDSIMPGETPSGMVKVFLDGSFGARNAAVLQPYSDGTTGELIHTDGELLKLLLRCGETGLMPAVHAIGARALSQLDRVSHEVFRMLNRGFPIRIEHAEDVSVTWPGSWHPDYHIFSMQPNFVERWQGRGGMYDRNLSAERSRKLNPFRTIKSSGFVLGFGSDSMPFDPLYGVHGAVYHRNSEQSLTVGEALKAYTLDSAFISGLDHLAVPLRAGRTADIAFLSGNPFHGLDGIFVEGTMKNGKVVHGMERFPGEIQ